MHQVAESKVCKYMSITLYCFCFVFFIFSFSEFYKFSLSHNLGFSGGRVVKNLLANSADSGIWSLGQEDPLEEEMATHSSILAWKIPWREEPGGLQSQESQRRLSTHMRYIIPFRIRKTKVKCKQSLLFIVK